MRTCGNCGKSVPHDVKFCTSCGSGNIFDSERQVSEYKRVCNECGTSWHSLMAREDEIRKGIKDLKSPTTQCCNMCMTTSQKNNAAQEKNASKIDSLETELDRLKKCPHCNSGNYKEELLVYEKK
jgi:hypothetical protein